MTPGSPSVFLLPLLITLSQNESKRQLLTELVTQSVPTNQLTQLQWHWVNPDDTLSIDHVRQLQTEFSFSSASGNIRVFVLDNLETASIPAQQALLKMVEEPPVDTLLVLVTANPSQVLPTLHSRTQLVVGEQGPLATDQLAAAKELYQQLTQNGLSGVFDQTDQLTERLDAKQMVQNLLLYLQTLPPTAKTTSDRLALLEAYRHLQTNVNLKLIMEQCFFQLAAG